MRTNSRLIERYIIGAVVPYLLLSLLLLTAILFTQQAGRFGELLMGANVPPGMVFDLALSLLPNVLVFTLPMALLTGILIGFSRLGSDSELVAMRAAGVGTWQQLWPVLLIGALLTAAALYVNLEMAPGAARSLRRVGARAALYKLDSPVEPRSFSVIGAQSEGRADSPVYVIYVRDGDRDSGQWGRVFLHTEMKDGSVRIVTARSGRIDSGGEQSELVLSDVVLTSLPKVSDWGRGQYATEHLEQWRIVLETGRKRLLESIRRDETEAGPNEMGLRALATYAAAKGGTEGREASTLLHKRLALALSPLLFAFLGAALGMSVRKGGRGMGALLSVLVMLLYYLLTLAGEQMARAGTVQPFLGAWLSSFVTVCCGFLLLARRWSLLGRFRDAWRRGRRRPSAGRPGPQESPGEARWQGFPGLLDMSVLRAIALNFTVAYASLVLIFLVFTLFELWRFIIMRGVGVRTVGEYLLFLLPLVSIQLLPASILLAVLATYALMARRNEAIAWWAGGQSAYRLMLPGLVFTAVVAACFWVVQERVMPQANLRQDALRAQIRGGVARATVDFDRQWLASAETGRLYSYQYEETDSLKNLVVYEFDPDRIHLRKIVASRSAGWASVNTGGAELRGVVSLGLEGEGWGEQGEVSLPQVEPPEVFKPAVDKPSHLSATALSDYIKTMKRRGGSVPPYEVALQKKYAGPFGVLVMALIGVPLALSFGRRSAILALCFAVVLGLGFWAVSGGFQQIGEYGLLPPLVAAWSPVLVFAATGLYLLSRTRT
ncbi:MAG TPA: LptF/LptG family permease [Pyrinomonadaceae bacterium]|jgi:LPS export ABC transporter permease LptG